MKEVKVWKTSDESLFENKDEAEKYENKLLYEEKLQNLLDGETTYTDFDFLFHDYIPHEDEYECFKIFIAKFICDYRKEILGILK